MDPEKLCKVEVEETEIDGEIVVIEIDMIENIEDPTDETETLLTRYLKEEIDDIANIPLSDDLSNEPGSLSSESEKLKEEVLDNKEMAILENDLQTITDGYEHLNFSNTPESESERKVTEKNSSDVSKEMSINCRFCRKTLSSKATYLRHLLKLHARKAFVLKPNGSGNEANISLKKPVKKRKAPIDEVPQMCHICGKIFRNAASYRNHLRAQHNPDKQPIYKKRAPRMCDFCGKICSGGTFKEHVRRHSEPERVTCMYCGKIFSFASVLKSHIRVRHCNERPYQCEICPSSFKRADYLRSHIRFKHTPKVKGESAKENVKCTDCGACFRNLLGLDKHRSHREEKDGEPPRCPSLFTCSICQLSFKKRNYLILHKRYVHEKKKPFQISESSTGPYKCDQCERRFASVCGRNYHCKHTHGTTFTTKFSEMCDHCGLTFHNRVFFSKHRARLQPRPTCYLCWADFDTQGLLQEHIHHVHVDDLPFLCQTCNHRFVTLRQLNDHIRSKHDLIRPFKCGYCNHSAVRKDSLEIHIRSCHLQEKPYKCDLCDKAFSQASDVRKHRIIHTRSKNAHVTSSTLASNLASETSTSEQPIL